MKALLRRALGADRPKIVIVISVSRETADRALAWLRTQHSAQLPLWCFCAEACDPVPGYDRFFARATQPSVDHELREQWPALSIISWTGEPGHNSLKLRSMLRPPFRLLFINEAGDLFNSPRLVGSHVLRRLSEKWQNSQQGVIEFIPALGAWCVRVSKQRAEYFRALGRALYWKTRNFLHQQVRGRLLFGFAFCAQWSTPVSRLVFATFHGDTRLDLELPTITELSVCEIPLTGRKWNAREIQQRIEASRETIILFRQQGEDADASELLEMFLRPDIFAAALQIQQTDWRRKLLPKFPFRKLQQGEISRTLAPYSSLLAMRRDAISHFRFPEVNSAGSAYMLLCWQAAAAGLHCYTLGSTRQVSQEVDVPLEHAEFVRTLLDKQPLRELMPVEPELSRGNISTSLSTEPFRGKPRVLVLSPYLPYPLAHGGAVRIYNLCRELAAHIDFILLCFREAGDTVHYDVLGQIFREVHVVDNDEKNRDPRLPKQIPEYRNAAMRAMVTHLCTTRNVDLLQIEYTQMAEYRDCKADRPVLLVEHDVTFTLYRQIWQSQHTKESESEYLRWLSFESRALLEADCIWAMSNHDRALMLEHGATASRTITVPNGVDLSRYRPRAKLSPDLRVLFIGSFRHLPNLLAFEALRDRIMPQVWKTLPHVELHVIAGPNHEHCAHVAGKGALLQNDSRIRMVGFTEDVRAAYQDSDVVAIPLPVSAGTNIKLMEALACGRASVSTPVGCVGLDLIDGSDLFIRTIEDGFAQALIRLLADPVLRDQMAQHARQTAEARFGWEAIAQQALAGYEMLLAHVNT